MAKTDINFFIEMFTDIQQDTLEKAKFARKPSNKKKYTNQAKVWGDAANYMKELKAIKEEGANDE